MLPTPPEMKTPMGFALLGFTACLAAEPEPPVLLLDDFDTAANTEDVNGEIDRQTGTLAGTRYLQGHGTYDQPIRGSAADESANAWQTQVNNSDHDTLWLVGTNGSDTASVSPDHNFNADPGAGKHLSIRFDLNPGDTDWGGITVGASDNAEFGASGTGARGQFINTAATHFGFLIRGSGEWQAFDGSKQVAGGAVSAVPGNAHIEVRISGTNGDENPFDADGDALVEVRVNDVLVCSHTQEGGYADNFITLQGFSWVWSVHAFDNLQIAIAP